MEEYDFEKLAREIVASRLEGLEAASDVASEIARKILVSGVHSTKLRQDPRLTVSGVCRGVMSGMLLINTEMPATAAKLLGQMAGIAQEVHLDPMDMMTWAMEGIAQVARVAGVEAQHAIHEAIEAKFMGAGEVFDKLCESAGKAP